MTRTLLLSLILLASGCKTTGQPATFATAPELRECEGKPLVPYEGDDKVRLMVRVRSRTPRSFSPVSLCVRVDDQLVPPEPRTVTIDKLRGTISFVGVVPPGEHKVRVDVTMAGLTGSDIEGHRFTATTDKDLSAHGKNELLDVVLTAGGPPEQRLVFKWEEPSAPASETPIP